MMFKFCLLSICLLGTLKVVSMQVCTNTSQCPAGHCCQILNPYPVVSKRDLPFRVAYPTTGTCEPYVLEGENCDPFGKINGYCSCEPGTTCTHFPLTTVVQSVSSSAKSSAKRLLLPGYYRCA